MLHSSVGQLDELRETRVSGQLGTSVALIYQVKRTVATLYAAGDNPDSASCGDSASYCTLGKPLVH
jgi:hypothetical protein